MNLVFCLLQLSVFAILFRGNMKDKSGKRRPIPEGIQALIAWIAFAGIVFAGLIIWKASPQGFRETVEKIKNIAVLVFSVIFLCVLIGLLIYGVVYIIKLYRKDREQFRVTVIVILSALMGLVFLGLILFAIELADDVFDFLWGLIKKTFRPLY